MLHQEIITWPIPHAYDGVNSISFVLHTYMHDDMIIV
jgi:hypothetical protein